MVPRTLKRRLVQLSRQFPVVTLTGPRQSGKTTLCRALFPRKPYVSLEAPDVRNYALADPRGFLSQYRTGAILDEVQRAPELLSYLQGEVDANPTAGRFILTGSANLALLQGVSQSLAGRTGLLSLLPLGREEIVNFPRHPESLFDALFCGCYPAIFDRRLSPRDWLAAYLATYVERDVRQILNVTDLLAFQRFLQLCAGRSAHLLNLSGLAADAGITHNTARAWISVLEASYIVFRLTPLQSSRNKRLVKTPKLHFYDTGLLCYLLGIEEPEQLRRHPLRGPVFETWVVSEIVKARVHRGLAPSVAFYRDRKGAEVDGIVELGEEVVTIEAKSGETVSPDFFTIFERIGPVVETAARALRRRSVVVYGGGRSETRAGCQVVPWNKLKDLDLWGVAEPTGSRR